MPEGFLTSEERYYNFLQIIVWVKGYHYYVQLYEVLKYRESSAFGYYYTEISISVLLTL